MAAWILFPGQWHAQPCPDAGQWQWAISPGHRAAITGQPAWRQVCHRLGWTSVSISAFLN